MNMRRAVWWSLGMVAMAGIVAYFVAQAASRSQTQRRHPHEGHPDFHSWLHQNLQLSEEQLRILQPIEKRFEEMSKATEEEIKAAGRELAAAIQNYSSEAPEPVEAALSKLHVAQGKLQKITLRHFFDMKEHLSKAQGDRLIQWTRDSILHGNNK